MFTEAEVAPAPGPKEADQEGPQEEPLADLQALSAGMTNALKSAKDCVSPTTGLSSWLGAGASLGAGGSQLRGPQEVAELVCALWGETVGWGHAVALRPVGTCAEPHQNSDVDRRCSVALNVTRADTGTSSIGSGWGVARSEAGWRFMGDHLQP
jgi:hypothetical protein